MAAKQLPVRPSLEQYKKQAKDLLKKYRQGDRDALQRVAEYHPRIGKLFKSGHTAVTLALADAQWVVAREHGFASWVKFAQTIATLTLGSPSGRTATDASVGRRLEIKTEEI